MTILITGSAGKTASNLASLLSAAKHPILVASRKPQPGAPHPTTKFDWLDRATWSLPFEHPQAVATPITAAYLVSPDIQAARDNVIPFVRLALERGVRRFVLLSAWEIPEGGDLLGRAHAELKEMGDTGMVDWCVLRPQFFMENFAEPYHLPCIRNEGKIYTACGDGKKPYISARDIAAVAYQVLTDPLTPNTDHVLTGSESLTYDEVAKIFTEVLGKQVEHVKLTKEELKEKLLGFEYPEDMAEYLAELDHRVSQGLGWEPTNNVTMVTTKEPRKFMQIVEDMKEVWL